MPTAVPTMPCARLKWPVPRVMSATISGTMHAEHRGRDAVEHLHGDQQRTGSVHDREQHAADRQRGERRAAAAAGGPICAPVPDPRRDQRDHELRHDDAGRDQHRRPLARPHRQHAAHQRQHRGVGEMEQQRCSRARISSGRCAARPSRLDAARVGAARGWPPCARSGSTSRGADAAQRQQRRDQQHGGDEEHRAVGEQVAARAHRGGRDAVADRGEARIAAEPLADRRVADQAEADRRRWQGPSTQLAAACSTAAAEHDRKDRPQRVSRARSRRSPRPRRRRPAAPSAPHRPARRPASAPTSATRPPIDSTRPMSTCVHFCDVR